MKAPEHTTVQTKPTDSANTSPSFNSAKITHKRAYRGSLPHGAHSSRSSLHMFPIISGLVDKQNLEIGKMKIVGHEQISVVCFLSVLCFFVCLFAPHKCVQFGANVFVNRSIDFARVSIEYGALRNGSFPSYHSSNTSLDKNWTPAPKDLYSWMAEQHRPRKNTLNKEQAANIIVSLEHFLPK